MHRSIARTLTKERQDRSSYIMSRRDRDLMIAAAYKVGESRSEFLRRACRERALKILSHDHQAAVNE